MRILFMGTPDFAAVSLEALAKSGHEICGVFSQPDKPVGRHFTLTPTPVKVTALNYGYKVFQPETLRDKAALPILEELEPELIVVAAYGRKLPSYILDYPKYGCINVHASLLPKYRGAAPINFCLINGEKETGVTIMYMAEGIDTGDMIDKVSTPITDEDNAETIHDRLADLGGKLLLKVIEDLEKGTAVRTPQNHNEHTYAPMIHKEDCKIDFKNKTAREVFNFVRGLSPFPTAYTVINGKNYKVYSCKVAKESGTSGEVICADPKKGFIIACKEGAIEILEILPQGKKKMDAKSFLLGRAVKEGDITE